jgi:hypothetical protein
MLIASDCIHKLPPFVVDSLSSILLVGGSFFILSDFALASPLRGQAKFGINIFLSYLSYLQNLPPYANLDPIDFIIQIGYIA